MSNKKKDNIDLTDFDVMPDVLDGKHQVIPIITGGDEVTENVAIPESLPILSLRSSVLFPGAITPITVGREKSIKLVRDVNAEGGLLGAVLQRESEVEIPAPDDMYKVGTAARIIKILEMPNGNLTVILSGLEKIEVGEYLQSEPYLRATVRTIRDSQPDAGNVEFQALVDSVREVSLNIINISPSMPKEAAFAIKNIDSQRGLINFICSNMDFSDEDRQALLEAPGLLARARKLLEILVREQQLAELKGEIQEKVKREIDKQQRDYYLQQQMRTIQDELGDSTDAEIEQMREAAGRHKAQGRHEVAHTVPLRASGCGQDVARTFRGYGLGTQVRPHISRRPARRGRDPRPPPYLHRRHARTYHPDDQTVRFVQSGDHTRRGGQGDGK